MSKIAPPIGFALLSLLVIFTKIPPTANIMDNVWLVMIAGAGGWKIGELWASRKDAP